jgi:hypothetical protein
VASENSLIKPDILSFWRLLEGRLFKVPNYQRAYSWEWPQRRDLFEDITKLIDSDKDHFMATIVCLKKSVKSLGTNQFDELTIVDGQQRLTSLVILLKAISKELFLSKNHDEVDEAKELNSMLIKPRGERPILLQTNHDNSNFFSEYLKNGIIPNKENCKRIADLNLFNAMKESENFVSKWKKNYNIFDLLSIIKNRLWFVLHTLDNERTVYTVFEVLNSRGLSVDWLDKCKSMLMGIVFDNIEENNGREDLIKEMHKLWQKIYEEIGLDRDIGDKIIPAAATLKDDDQTADPLGAEKSMDYFRSYCLAIPERAVEVTSWILDVTKQLVSLKNNPYLEAITKVSHVRLLYISINLRDDLNDYEKETLLYELEKVAFRIFGLSDKDSRSKGGVFNKLAQQIYHKYIIINTNGKKSLTTKKVLPKNIIIDYIRKLGDDCPIDKALNELLEKDLYEANNWRTELLYLLYKYERHLSISSGTVINDLYWKEIWNSELSKTIEHVYPQCDEKWEKKINKKYLHTLGNLTVLTPTANSQAKDKVFEGKKEIYLKQSYLLINKEIIDESEWNEDTILERQMRIIDWAKIEWG